MTSKTKILIYINDFSKGTQELIDKLLLWKPNTIDDFGEEHAKFLHHVGEKEQILIAERFAERFPSLLKGDYHPELFKFRSTYTHRYLKLQNSMKTVIFDVLLVIQYINCHIIISNLTIQDEPVPVLFCNWTFRQESCFIGC